MNRALIIGVSKYEDSKNGLGSLPAVTADVAAIRNLLSSDMGAFSSGTVTVLKDKDATQKEISDRLSELFAAAEQTDTVFIYIAGHGLPSESQYYFLPYDAAAFNIKTTSILLDDVRKAFEKCRSERAIMWLDFCHSGGMLDRSGNTAPPADFDLIERALKPVQGDGKVIMTACASDQKAYESPVLGHGRFTAALIKGLKGDALDSAGEVTVNSLHDFVDREIANDKQRPMFYGKLKGRIVLMRGRSPDLVNAIADSTIVSHLHPVYTALTQSAAELCMFDEWEVWTSYCLASDPMWKREWLRNVEAFRRKIERAVWPGTNEELERSLKCLAANLSYASEIFLKRATPEDDGFSRYPKFYRDARRGLNEYNRLLECYNEETGSQYHFMISATKAANWVANVVRRTDSNFCAVRGKFTYDADGSVLEFTDSEKALEPTESRRRWDAFLVAEKKREEFQDE